MKAILALDQGTTSSRAILFDHDGRKLGMARRTFSQIFPQPGWVEHDPHEIWQSQLDAARQVLAESGIGPADVAAVGITNQRETTIVWDRHSGEPVYNAIVWQCRRTAPLCEALTARGVAATLREKTGLVPDPYFSATKLAWMLDQVPGVRARAERGDLLFGTVDTWLVWQLTAGRVHATDVSNASRTLLFNIHTMRWDEELLHLFKIPVAMLPRVLPSSGSFGVTDRGVLGDIEIPITGIAGDQQAALFGQTCFTAGTAKNTYGTGCFLLQNTGTQPTPSRHGLLTTVSWQIDDEVTYALEGSVFTAGAAIQWLRDEMGLLATAAESETMAREVPDTGGVYLVPAFTGLGAPHWDSQARGALFGLTRGTQRAHIVRAALEAIAYQTRDVLEAMQQDSGERLQQLRVDGGAAANDFLLQFQADLLGVPVLRPQLIETTALGAAFLAGLAVGFWRDRAELSALAQVDRVFTPAMSSERRLALMDGWRAAVRRTVQSG